MGGKQEERIIEDGARSLLLPRTGLLRVQAARRRSLLAPQPIDIARERYNAASQIIGGKPALTGDVGNE